jgi:hypothetical protein
MPPGLNIDPAAVRHRIAHLCSLLTLDLYGIRSITIYYRRRDLIYTIIRDALNPAVSNDAVFTRFSRASEEHPWLDEMIERRLSNGECFGITKRESPGGAAPPTHPQWPDVSALGAVFRVAGGVVASAKPPVSPLVNFFS